MPRRAIFDLTKKKKKQLAPVGTLSEIVQLITRPIRSVNVYAAGAGFEQVVPVARAISAVGLTKYVLKTY